MGHPTMQENDTAKLTPTQPDEILSLPTIQILPKGLVTTRNNQGRRDSGRGTGVHS